MSEEGEQTKVEGKAKAKDIHDIRRPHKPIKHLPRPLLFEIERHAPLVPIDRAEVQRHAAVAPPRRLGLAAPRPRLVLDARTRDASACPSCRAASRAGSAGRRGPQTHALPRLLNLDDVGAVVGQCLGAKGTGEDAGQVEDADVVEGAARCGGGCRGGLRGRGRGCL